MTATRSVLFRASVLALAGAALLLPDGAHAYWRGGVFFGFPGVYAPPPVPYYYPPPAYYAPYYAPPRVYVAPPAYSSVPVPQTCYAGPLVCPMEQPTAPGSACYCTGYAGRIWGRAN